MVDKQNTENRHVLIYQSCFSSFSCSSLLFSPDNSFMADSSGLLDLASDLDLSVTSQRDHDLDLGRGSNNLVH